MMRFCHTLYLTLFHTLSPSIGPLSPLFRPAPVLHGTGLNPAGSSRLLCRNLSQFSRR